VGQVSTSLQSKLQSKNSKCQAQVGAGAEGFEALDAGMADLLQKAFDVCQVGLDVDGAAGRERVHREAADGPAVI
jgi:hypothetical protein